MTNIGETNADGFIVLPLEFERKRFKYRQLRRAGNIAIYERNGLNHSDNQTHFETVIIQNNDTYEIAGKTIAARESYPCDNSWGTFGFTHLDINRAKIKFEELSKLYEKQRG